MYGRREDCETIKRERDNLRYEVEDMRADRERREEQEREERERRRREMRAETQERLAEVDNWPEAFARGIPLIETEVRREESGNAQFANDPDWKVEHWFAGWLAHVNRAKQFYSEVMGDIERQVAELRRGGLEKVADRLAAEDGETETVAALRDNNPAFLTYW